MSEKTHAKRNKLSYLEIKFDNQGVENAKEFEFTRSYGKHERRIALSAAEAALLHARTEAAIQEIYNLRRTDGRHPSGSSTISIEAPEGKALRPDQDFTRPR